MLGIGKDIENAPFFDDLSLVHDGDPIGQFSDNAEVVGDEDDPHIVLQLEPAHQLEDPLLDGHVKGRGGFVGDQDRWLTGHRHGDHHTLLLATG